MRRKREKILKEIMAEIFPNLLKAMHLHREEEDPSRIHCNANTRCYKPTRKKPLKAAERTDSSYTGDPERS
jgi:hypothetical protein